jgi:hypothetical protein
MKIHEIIVESRRTIREGIAHPEDAIFSQPGVQGAMTEVDKLAAMAVNPESTTIKWDGFPALIFGRDVDGQLIVSDKHMFDKKDGSGRVKSPEQFLQYDQNRGANRGDPNSFGGNLYDKINTLWPALEQVIPRNFRGFYFGDLLYAGKPPVQGGFFVFKPNVVTYKVKQNSPAGAHIAASLGGIAVHTFIPGIGEPDRPLNGLGGLPPDGPIWFVTGEMPVPQVKIDTSMIAKTKSLISSNEQAVDNLKTSLMGMKAKGVIDAISPYITSKITAGSFDNMLAGFYKFLETKLSEKAKTTLLANGQGYLYKEGAAGLKAVFEIWVAIYNLKLNIKKQIDGQQATGDIQAFTGNDPGHEGYVVGGGADKMKLIDRLGFSRANFTKNG